MNISYTDKQLLAYLMGLMNSFLSTYNFPAGFGPIVAQQKQQPTQQGVPNKPTIFIEKLFDKRYGFVMLDQTYVNTSDDFTESEIQMYETTFQISSLVIQDPRHVEFPTASDLANLMCSQLQSRAIIRDTIEHDISVMRVTDVRNPYFTDDRDRQEATPSFDLVVSYARILTNSVPKIQASSVDIYPV